METIRKDMVLAAIDFSEITSYVIDQAIGLAKLFNYHLWILHVKEPKKSKFTEEEIYQKVSKISDDIFKRFNIKPEFFLREGDPFATVGKISNELGANYLVIGSRGKTGIEYVFGNYASKIIQSSDSPVLVVQRANFKEGGYKKIILPIDYSTETIQKVKWAIAIARASNGIVHILGKHTTDQYYVNKERGHIIVAKRLFEKYNIHYTETYTKDTKSAFGKQAIQYAIELDADLIVAMTDLDSMMPSFLSNLMSLSHGEEEEFIEKASKIPFLCVNPQEIKLSSDGWWS